MFYSIAAYFLNFTRLRITNYFNDIYSKKTISTVELLTTVGILSFIYLGLCNTILSYYNFINLIIILICSHNIYVSDGAQINEGNNWTSLWEKSPRSCSRYKKSQGRWGKYHLLVISCIYYLLSSIYCDFVLFRT